MPTLKKKPVAKPALSFQVADPPDPITSPYSDTVRWAIYDLERSNEKLVAVMEGLEQAIGDMSSTFAEKIDDLVESLKNTATALEELKRGEKK